VQYVSSVAAEVRAIEKCLTGKFGYEPDVANEISGDVRRYLKGDDEDPDKAVGSITEVLVVKYGYESVVAQEIAERVRRFLDGSADASCTGHTSTDPVSMRNAASEKPTSSPIRAQLPGVPERVPKSTEKRSETKKTPTPPQAVLPLQETSGRSSVLDTKELDEFYLTVVRPYLAGDPRRGRLADVHDSNRAFGQMKFTLPAEFHGTLAALQTHCHEHRQSARLQRLHYWMHWWLTFHIPMSMILYLVVVVHIAVALRVVPFLSSGD